MKFLRGWLWVVILILCIWLPPFILFSVLATHLAPKPRRWLLLIAIASELLTSLPLGISTLVVFTPLLLRRWFPSVEPSSPLSFFALLLGTVSVQYLFLASWAVSGGIMEEGFRSVWRYMPWLPLLSGVVLCSLTAFFFFTVRRLFLPQYPAR